MNIYFDLESIPGQNPSVRDSMQEEAEEEKANVRAPANYKDEAKIREYIATQHAEIDAKVDERWRKTALDGAYGHVVVVAIAIDGQQTSQFFFNGTRFEKTERELLGSVFKYLSDSYNPSRMARPVFIGHNILNFDLRFLYQRAVILGIEPPGFIPFNAKPWDDNVFDTMTRWAGVGNRISLDKLCRVFGLPGKSELDGSKVWDYVKDGRIAEVAEYCKQDVERVLAIHRRMTFQEGR